MKKWLAILMALLMAMTQLTVLAEDIDAQYEHLVVGNTTAFNGNFSVHNINHTLYKRKSKTVAFHSVRGVALIEFFKYVFPCFR